MDFGSANWAAFKEPKAFIKILQVILAIIAFALTTNFSSSSSFDVKCQGNVSTVLNVSLSYSYPFHINNPQLTIVCGVTQDTDVFFGNFTSQSQFYVFVGVLAMLYCFAAVVLYVFFHDICYSNERIPKADFVISLVIAALWFIASVAWADGVSKLKFYTSPNTIMQRVTYCNQNPKRCFNLIYGNYGGLDASLVGGFGNMLVWLGNLWFLFKETLWYERRGDERMMGSESMDGGNM